MPESNKKGVYWHKKIGKWHAVLHYNGTRYHLGFFTERQDALNKRRDVKDRIELLTGRPIHSRTTRIDTLLKSLEEKVESGEIETEGYEGEYTSVDPTQLSLDDLQLTIDENEGDESENEEEKGKEDSEDKGSSNNSEHKTEGEQA